MKLGYITNGLAHHELGAALDILAELGYQGVGLTLDVNHLDPFRCTAGDVAVVRGKLVSHNLSVAIETGARFLLDPRRKHEPTLISPQSTGRARRIDFYRRAMDIGQTLGAKVVSIWSGRLQDGVDREEAWDWLVSGCRQVAGMAAERGQVVGFEPEPGMLVESIEGYRELATAVAHQAFKLTLDIGHLACVEREPPAEHILAARDDLVHLHIDDIRGGVHEHLPLGQGEIDFRPVLAAVREIDYKGLLLVELSRDSHRAPTVAREALRLLREWIVSG